MLRDMPAPLFAEWRAFEALEPFGSEVESKRAAQMPWLYANSNRKRGTPARKMRDFEFRVDDAEDRAASKAWKEQALMFDNAVAAAFQKAKNEGKRSDSDQAMNRAELDAMLAAEAQRPWESVE